MNTQAVATIQKYYAAFNAGLMEEFFSLLDENVVHDINQGGKEVGKKAFAQFMDRMNQHYKERAEDLVLLANEDGTRASAEFFIVGKYLSTDTGLPEARGQQYRLRCGAFFELKNNKITRVTNYYNLSDWLSQVE